MQQDIGTGVFLKEAVWAWNHMDGFHWRQWVANDQGKNII